MSEAIVGGEKPIGVRVEAGQTYWWCSCGRSKNQPYCDGSHQVTSLRPLEWVAPESRAVFFCTCKQTTTAPLCDGSHNALPK